MNDFHTSKIVRLLGNFAIVNNLSRQKCCISIILAMIQTRRVQFYELGLVLNDQVKPESNEDRIQRFFAEAQFNEEELAFLLSLFLTLGKVDLCLDRTEWDFGKKQVNLLVMSAYCQGIGLPLYVDFLDNNSGNSSAHQRISILKKTIELLGKFRIAGLCADREFIGKEWFTYLLRERIPFFIRVPKSYWFTIGGVSLKAGALLGDRKQCKIDGISAIGLDGLSVGIAKVDDKNNQSDLLIVLTNTYAYLAIRHYQKRWSIEAMFQDFKKQGFNVEDTHIPSPERIVKMVYLVAIAYAWCIHVGITIERKDEEVSRKNHGYRAKSIFRKGMDRLRADLYKKSTPDLTLWNELTERFIRMARIKLLIHNMLLKS
jgi:hypothetical protein